MIIAYALVKFYSILINLNEIIRFNFEPLIFRTA